MWIRKKLWELLSRPPKVTVSSSSVGAPNDRRRKKGTLELDGRSLTIHKLGDLWGLEYGGARG